MRLVFRANSNRIHVFNKKKNEHLGDIFLNYKWKCHVWEQCDDVIMSKGCLQEVIGKLGELDNLKTFGF